MYIEETNSLHDIIHLKPIKLEESDQQISHQQLSLALTQLVRFVLVLHIGHNHQHQCVGTYTALVRS